MARKPNPDTEKRWRKLLARLSKSRQSTTSFAAEYGVSTASIYYWKKRLGMSTKGRHGRQKRTSDGRKAAPAASSEASFVRLTVTGTDRVEIELPSGLRIHVPPTHIEALQAAIHTSHAIVSEGRPC